MQRTPRSREKNGSFLDRSNIIGQERQNGYRQVASNHSKLSQLQEKLRHFGGLEEMQEQFLKDINTSNQRLDNIISIIKTVMKMDTKSRKASVSPLNKSTKAVDKNKSSKRLIERVEKAIVQQNLHSSVK